MSPEEFRLLDRSTEALQTLRRKEAKKAAGGSWFG